MARGLRPFTHPLRRTGLASDVLHDRDGALAHERDGHRMGAHAVARDTAGGVGGVEEVQSGAMSGADLEARLGVLTKTLGLLLLTELSINSREGKSCR